jgi:hypothetical protein
MKKKILAAVMALGLVASSGIFADNVGPGLGRVLLKGQKGKVMEILAITLNGLAGNGIFAITFGTLGYKDGAAIGMAASDAFIAENFDAVANDIARGDGEYIDTLSSILKVSDKVSFKNTLQKNFDSIYSSPDVTSGEVSAKIKSFI